MVTSTKNPIRIYVEEFSNEQNEEEGILEEFLDMIRDSTVKASFEDESLEKFWGMMEKAYSKVAKKPLTLLTVFPSTYLCKSAFSSVVAVKIKTQNKLLDLDSDLCCAIAKIAAHISLIVS